MFHSHCSIRVGLLLPLPLVMWKRASSVAGHNSSMQDIQDSTSKLHFNLDKLESCCRKHESHYARSEQEAQ